jgi:hypothetical protein
LNPLSNSTAKVFMPHLDNLRTQGDRLASAANVSLLTGADSEKAYIDRNYGHFWSFTPKIGAAVYGRTDEFPAAPIDYLARGNFLRVPFRRVPVIEVNSPEELEKLAAQMISADESIKVRWRGQNKEYYLTRSEEESLRLYGDASVHEPSLVPSAARSQLEFAQVFPSWAAILDVFISERVAAYAHQAEGAREMISFRSSYQYRLWAFATAQHYGLPSVGLDVTTDILTAVLFALHQFTFNEARGITIATRVGESADPVVYAMGGFENDLFDDKDLAPVPLQGERPKAQAAHFFGTGWGVGINKAAERIFIAFRLRHHTKWHLRKRIYDLFPRPEADPLLAFLLDARDRFAEVANEARLNKIYHVPE